MREGSVFERELSVALAAAEKAATILLERSGADQVREKGRADLVTVVDEAAERAIVEFIRDAFPDDLVIAEESSGPERPTGGRRWIVDPLDGTVNYVHGHPFSCVSIGFVDDDGPAVGVINAPFLGEVYEATRGGGARLNGAAIRVSTVSEPSAALLATGFPFKPGKGDPAEYLRMVGAMMGTTHGVRRAGAAALDLAYVAAGRVEGFFEIGLSPWDVAAGIVLVSEAGGTVTGWPREVASALESGRIVASNGSLHPWLEGVLGRYRV
ncbi:MAG: inositol monophosphatase [Gemmatimonadetes bacterium]|nr:inositol monophosphatase [Gemmatimonadota bacterium]